MAQVKLLSNDSLKHQHTLIPISIQHPIIKHLFEPIEILNINNGVNATIRIRFGSDEQDGNDISI